MAYFIRNVKDKAVSLAYFALVGVVVYGIYWLMSSIGVFSPRVDINAAAKPNAFVLDSKYRELMGPPVEDVMDELGGPGTAAENIEY